VKAVAEAVEAGEGVLQLPLAFSGWKKKSFGFQKMLAASIVTEACKVFYGCERLRHLKI
jgi:hypothetical protein